MDSDLDARKVCFAAFYHLGEWQVRFLKAFAYDIGANPFLVRHVQCLEPLDPQTTDFNIFAYVRAGLKLDSSTVWTMERPYSDNLLAIS